MNTEKQLTSKEKFDEEMKKINETLKPKVNPLVEAGMDEDEAEEYEEEVKAAEAILEEEEVEDEPVTTLDKSMGEKKVSHVATREQHQENKLEQTRQEILNKMKGVGGMVGEKLSPENQKKVVKLMELYAAGKIKNPVLKHLIKKKIDHAQEYAVLSSKAKEIQMEIIAKMGKIAEEIMQSKTKAELYNKDIIELADDFDKE